MPRSTQRPPRARPAGRTCSAYVHNRLAAGNLDSSLPVLRLLRAGGSLSQTEAARELGITPGACNLHLQRLEHEGLVRRTSRPGHGKGRPTVIWDLDVGRNACLTFVAEDAWLYAHLLDFSGEPLLEERISLAVASGAAIAQAVDGFARRARARCGQDRIRIRQAAGGFPGLLDARDGRVAQSANLPQLNGLNLVRVLAAHGIPAWSGSLSLCFFFGETLALPPPQKTTWVITWDLGVGAVCGQQDTILSIQLGPGGVPELPEFGHVCIQPGGTPCRCGRRGCLEAYVGGQALLARLAPHGISSLNALLAAVQGGQREACAALRAAAQILGRQLAWPVQLMDAHRVILAGRLSEAGTVALPALRKGMAERLPPNLLARIDVLPSPAPLARVRTGAFRLAMQAFFDPQTVARLPRSPARLD
jgi:predicted NBD/HSP70 family sugar kinase